MVRKIIQKVTWRTNGTRTQFAKSKTQMLKMARASKKARYDKW